MLTKYRKKYLSIIISYTAREKNLKKSKEKRFFVSLLIFCYMTPLNVKRIFTRLGVKKREHRLVRLTKLVFSFPFARMIVYFEKFHVVTRNNTSITFCKLLYIYIYIKKKKK